MLQEHDLKLANFEVNADIYDTDHTSLYAGFCICLLFKLTLREFCQILKSASASISCVSGLTTQL